MTMFPANMLEMPPEMMGPVMDNPQGFADAMGAGNAVPTTEALAADAADAAMSSAMDSAMDQGGSAAETFVSARNDAADAGNAAAGAEVVPQDDVDPSAGMG